MFKADLAHPPTTSFDLTMDRPVARTFGAFPGPTIGFGPYTMYGAFGIQVLDSSNLALGPPVPAPPDMNELAISHDGRYIALGRLGGHVDLYTGSGKFIDTVSINEPQAVTGASFTYDGEFMVVGTREGRFGLWTTDPLERIEVPDPGDWVRTKLMGDWLFVSRSDGSLIRLDPSTFEQVGDPVPNAEGFLLFAKLDEENLRVAAGVAQGVKVFDLGSGLQLGQDLPYNAPVARVEFTADGTVLSLPNNDGVSLWNFDTDTWADIACEMAGRNLTADEWDQLGPRTIERRATCSQYPLG